VTNDQSTDQARYQSTRRSLYLPIIRNAMYGFFAAFDYNDPSTPIDVRPETVAAPQALFLMNSDEVVSCARTLASLALAAEPEREGDRIAWLWRRTLCREPSARERQAAIDFLNRIQSRGDAVPTAGGTEPGSAPASSQSTSAPSPQHREVAGVEPGSVWAGLAHVLLVSNEFLYVD
ncbi:MAG: DUF1553 domain-containing protein, partial [Planctomycetes bacterium]|nr:DUF1553 domain-containing protein [Planctomycetota bacterium]